LVEVVSSWSNYLVDVLNLGQTCDNFTLIIWGKELCSNLWKTINLSSRLLNRLDDNFIINYW
jgi:hypothetical protein